MKTVRINTIRMRTMVKVLEEKRIEEKYRKHNKNKDKREI